ncbi:MAG: xylulose kinase, partial [Actinobacteria bacterium]|nr:xylulose kinase [Actinomycetota bacterium]
YFSGERTPNLPEATGSLLGMTNENMTPANIARAAVEGVLCGLADALDALVAQGATVNTVRLVGGAAGSAAVRAIAPLVFGVPVLLPAPGEYVADGAARQAASVLAGSMPDWPVTIDAVTQPGTATARVRERYAEARAHWIGRPGN